MKILITDDGRLWIDRKNEMTSQLCPYKADHPCGDWCPFFMEPRIAPGGKISIEICNNKTLCCDQKDFQDGRG